LDNVDLFCSLYNKKLKDRKSRISSPIKKARGRKSSCKYKLEKFEKYQLVCRLAVTIKRHFLDFYSHITELPDSRKRPLYEVQELIVSGLLMFLFKQKSRNQADNTAKNIDYQDNIQNIFGVKVADMDTVDKYLRWLNPDKLERIKQDMFRELVKSKTFQNYKFAGKYFMLAIDGSGFQSYSYEPYPGCTYKKSKKGKKTWTTYVLEARIVTSNGFSISLATEWIENPTNRTFDKQDCEIKAFKRLASRLKKEFPRLPLVLLLDGLYPKEPIFNICKNNKWRWKIENEGFNNQKNNGYNAGHKFSRTNFNATKNYYQLMQIADIINQLTYKIIHIQGFIKNFGLTINALIKNILSYLKAMEFDDFKLIEDILAKNVQLRY